jgi:hypothetical protein
MHSRIYQIGLKPFKPEDYACPEWFYEDSDDFADYIGNEITGDARLQDIKCLQSGFEEIFDLDGETLVFKGFGNFIQEWNDYIKSLTEQIKDDKYDQFLMWKISNATKETHLETASRFYIEDWNGRPEAAEDLIDFLQHQVKPGDKIYIGAVIDYHF